MHDFAPNIAKLQVWLTRLWVVGESTGEHCEIIMGHSIIVGTYHDVTMHTHVATTLMYYVLLHPIMIFLFS